MHNGKYIKNSTNFQKYTSKKFSPHLFNKSAYKLAGCGANALSLITGENPFDISEKNKHKDHYSDEFMIKHLRKNKFKVFTLNKCNLTNRETNVTYHVRENHIILMSQLFLKKEASWLVSWNDLVFHNFEIAPLDPFSLINCPIISAYVLYKNSSSD